METIDNNEIQRRSPSRAFTAIVFGLILLGSSVAAFAALPVYDAKVDITLNKNFIETITNLVSQLKQMQATQRYFELVDGGWFNKLEIPDVVKTRAAALGIPIDKIGFPDGKYKGKPATKASAIALEELRKVITGQADDSEMGNLRNDIEMIHGSAPATTAGVKVDAAYAQMAQVAATSGATQKAIMELQIQIKDITDEIKSGDLPPGDLERMKVLLEAKQADLKGLELQLDTQRNLLGMHQLGISASQEARIENSRLQERYDLLSARPLLTVRIPKDGGQGKTLVNGVE